MAHPPPMLPGPPSHPNQHYWRFNQSDSPGDFAPFHVEPMHPPPDPHNGHSFVIQQQRAEQIWQQQQQQPMRSMSYGQVEGIPSSDGYAGAFQANQQHHLPSMRDAPITLDVQSAEVMVGASGPHTAPIGPPHHMFIGQPHPATLAGDPNHANATFVGPHPGYPGNWYHDSPFAPVEEEHHDPIARDSPKYIGRTHQPG